MAQHDIYNIPEISGIQLEPKLTLRQNRKASIVGGGLFIVCLAFAALVGFRNYHGARSEIEADPPSALLRQTQSLGIADMQSVSFVTRDGLHIAAWYVTSKNRAAVLVEHGTNSDRASMLPEIRILSDAGFGVLAFDWPGLGESEGEIRWGAAARNALLAALDWTQSRSDVEACRIGALGFSMGGYVLTQVAARDARIRAIVLESAPSDFDSFVQIHFSKWGPLSAWPARWALRNTGLTAPNWSAAHLIGEISPRPLLLIAQAGDPVITSEMTRKLFQSARAPKSLWMIEGEQHGSFLEAAGDEYPRRLLEFFRENLVSAAATRGNCEPRT
jgi:pimeloyl-ACP methyl ester carboxylesterase